MRPISGIWIAAVCSLALAPPARAQTMPYAPYSPGIASPRGPLSPLGQPPGKILPRVVAPPFAIDNGHTDFHGKRVFEPPEPAAEQQPVAGREEAEDQVMRTQALQRYYVTSLSYDRAVAFYERELPRGGFTVINRATRVSTSDPRSTTWQARRTDGRPATVTVRATQPTEVVILESQNANTFATGQPAASPPQQPSSQAPSPGQQ
jgi:hypothetical protein